MPKHSRRIAARQAELAKRKKKMGPRPPLVFQEPGPGAPPETQTGTGDASHPVASAGPPVAPRPSHLPAFEVPDRVAAQPRPQPRSPAAPASRPAVSANPYLRKDLANIALIGAVMFAAMIVLAFVLN